MTDRPETSDRTMDALVISEYALPAPRFADFTYPRYRAAIAGAADAMEGSLVFGATVGGRPVGAALLAAPVADGHVRRLLSVVVAVAWRRRGVARALLRAVEDWARTRPALQSLTALHSDRMVNLQAWLALMQSAGWSQPELVQQRLGGRAGWTHATAQAWAPLWQRQDRQGFSITRLDQRSASDDASIASMVDAGLVEPYLALGSATGHAHPELTLLIRKHGAVAGWIVGEVARDVAGVLYTSGYVLPALRPAAWLVRGLWEVCRRQEALFGPDYLAIYETPADNTAMQRLMLDRLGPLGPLWIDRRYRCTRTLQDQNSRADGVKR